MRPRFVLALLVAFSLPGFASAEIKIEGELTVPEHKLIELTVSGANPDALILWDISPEDIADYREQGPRVLMAAEPGEYRVKVRVIDPMKKTVESARVVLTVIPKPNPDPNSKPVKPEPKKPDDKPKVDSNLVSKFKGAVKTDTDNKQFDKAQALALADVYDESATLLETLTDPAIAPKTWGDLYNKTFAVSLSKKIPRRPLLAAVRDEIENYVGKELPATALTGEMKDGYVTKYRAAATALREAVK